MRRSISGDSWMVVVMLATWLALLAIPSPAAAGRRLAIFTDEGLTQSTLEDNVPRIVNLFVVDSGDIATGDHIATGVIFATEPSPGFTGVWLGDASDYLFVGDSQTKMNIAYGGCHLLPVVALTMTYQFFGTSSSCSELWITPPDGMPCVLSPDSGCNWVEHCITDLGHLRVNCPVATESTTWGRVKALYR
jgi:hypothetical protein